MEGGTDGVMRGGLLRTARPRKNYFGCMCVRSRPLGDAHVTHWALSLCRHPSLDQERQERYGKEGREEKGSDRFRGSLTSGFTARGILGCSADMVAQCPGACAGYRRVRCAVVELCLPCSVCRSDGGGRC